MKRLLIFLFLLTLSFSCQTESSQGIVVSACDRYMDSLLPSISHLRNNLHSTLPIEVWYSGDELSPTSIDALSQFEGVTFHDISEVLYCNPGRYRGWHVKPWLIYLSSFDEVILMDADVYFYEDPRKLFSHPGYQKTGAFFFRDRGTWIYFSINQDIYLQRREFFRSLIVAPSGSMPSDWNFFWREDLPNDESPFLYHYMESGCVAMRKKDHIKSLKNIIQLNENAAVTYQYVYGDKETFWLGCEMAKEPYYVNHTRARELRTSNHEQVIKIMHFLDGDKLFFSQKHPVDPDMTYYFWDEYPKVDIFQKPITFEEKEKIHHAFLERKQYSGS